MGFKITRDWVRPCRSSGTFDAHQNKTKSASLAARHPVEEFRSSGGHMHGSPSSRKACFPD